MERAHAGIRAAVNAVCRGILYEAGGGVTIGIELGKGVGVAVSAGFNNIGTGESVVIGVAVGTGVVSTTVGEADAAGAVVSDSGDLEHEQIETTQIAARIVFIGAFVSFFDFAIIIPFIYVSLVLRTVRTYSRSSITTKWTKVVNFFPDRNGTKFSQVFPKGFHFPAIALQ
jgi:hypothetical protein